MYIHKWKNNKYIYIYIDPLWLACIYMFVFKLWVSIEYFEKIESKRSWFREQTSLLIIHYHLFILSITKKSNLLGMPVSPWIQRITLIITTNSKFWYIFLYSFNTSQDKGMISILTILALIKTYANVVDLLVPLHRRREIMMILFIIIIIEEKWKINVYRRHWYTEHKRKC